VRVVASPTAAERPLCEHEWAPPHDAALAAVTKLPPDEAAELLLAHRTHPRAALALLAALRARHAGAGEPASNCEEDGEADTDLH